MLAACAGTQPRDPHTYEVLAEASLPRGGLTREMLRVMGEVAREGAVALVLEEVGRDHGYDDTWRPGNRYYDRAAELVAAQHGADALAHGSHAAAGGAT